VVDDHPRGILLGSIGIQVLRRRWPILPAVFLGAVFAAGVPHARCSAPGRAWRRNGCDGAVDGMFDELRSPASGDGAPVGARRRLAAAADDASRRVCRHMPHPRPSGGRAHQKSHVAGGYYIGLVTPLLLYAAAVATVRLASRLATRLPWGDAAVTRVAATLALVVATVVRSAPGVTPSTIDHLRLIADETRADDWPIYTTASISSAHGVPRARAGVDALTIDRAMSVRRICEPRTTTGVCRHRFCGGRGTHVAISPSAGARALLEELARAAAISTSRRARLSRSAARRERFGLRRTGRTSSPAARRSRYITEPTRCERREWLRVGARDRPPRPMFDRPSGSMSACRRRGGAAVQPRRNDDLARRAQLHVRRHLRTAGAAIAEMDRHLGKPTAGARGENRHFDLEAVGARSHLAHRIDAQQRVAPPEAEAARRVAGRQR
jgi:hypothetical protein